MNDPRSTAEAEYREKIRDDEATAARIWREKLEAQQRESEMDVSERFDEPRDEQVGESDWDRNQ